MDGLEQQFVAMGHVGRQALKGEQFVGAEVALVVSGGGPGQNRVVQTAHLESLGPFHLRVQQLQGSRDTRRVGATSASHRQPTLC